MNARHPTLKELAVSSWQLAVFAWLPAARAPAGNGRGGQQAAPPEKGSQLPTANSPNLLIF
jgi:hypothetical protein